ncbi:hypothetical protein ACFUV2_35015 [Streptomyces pilosus]|uniref:hypothetical protein n=1 Tax=Streptomyces pilosus TaxID=28893 RepID=UPI00362A7ADF
MLIPCEFSPTAQADMDRLDLDVCEELLLVAETSLSRAPDNSTDEDEGQVGLKTLLWRRGITRERRRQLLAAEARGETVEEKGPGRHGWQYYIIYRPMSWMESMRTGKPNGLMVVRILGEEEVGTVGIPVNYGRL